ncbi:MAG: tetraacyldisaccharide 4'-kinase [Gammaproteobacteria bacterium]|nr:tetraacyldisaccharide 4'-kinase [Gammaproteobacteria bacterium]
MMRSLANYWYQPSVITWLILPLLLPLSWLYCVVSMIRRKLYQSNIIKSYAAAAPLVVVGNIVAGGSGKTPLLISLCEYIKANGYKPGVVSRGYGGNVTGVHQLTDSDAAAQVGDEPLMIQQRTQVPVVIGADRVAAVDYLLENNRCDIVLSDDGLQHYRMRRDLEIAVVDASRLFGNGFCLPAGPLREKVSRLQEVDLLVYNQVATNSEAVKSNAETCSYALKFSEFIHLSKGDRFAPEHFAGRSVHAVAGIGNPGRFFMQLRENEVEVTEHAFADHHAYQQSDFSGWQDACIIMTEKDAVKCRHLALPDAWLVRVDVAMSEGLMTQLAAKVLPLIKRSSR